MLPHWQMITKCSTMPATWFSLSGKLDRFELRDLNYDSKSEKWQWRLSTNICSSGNFCKYLVQCLQKYLPACIWAILLQTSGPKRCNQSLVHQYTCYALSNSLSSFGHKDVCVLFRCASISRLCPCQ